VVSLGDGIWVVLARPLCWFPARGALGMGACEGRLPGAPRYPQIWSGLGHAGSGHEEEQPRQAFPANPAAPVGMVSLGAGVWMVIHACRPSDSGHWSYV